MLQLSIEENDCSSTVYIPNVFSPNGDGQNDMLEIGIENIESLSNFELTIYNRWGSRIFNTVDPLESWSGMYKGQRVPIGTYILQLTYETTMNDLVDSHIVSQSLLVLR